MNFSPLQTLGLSLFLVALSYQTVLGGEGEARKTVEDNKESGAYLHQSKAAADPAQWLQFRLNRRLNGRTGLTSHITQPEIIWSQFVGARETWIVLRPSGKADKTIEVPSEDYQSAQHAAVGRRWGIAGPFYDSDGTGELSYVQPVRIFDRHQKIGDFLPKEAGLERVEFTSCFNTGGTGGGLSESGRLFKRSDGEWDQVWESEMIKSLYFPNTIVGDFDDDGSLEVAVTPWYDVKIFDLKTGELEHQARFTPEGAESGRGYGLLKAVDLDRDGKSEFIVMSGFQNMAAVLGWEDGKFVTKWRHLIEAKISNRRTMHTYGPEPVGDIDGDGRLEVITSIFNEENDERWHTIAFDGLTGDVKADLPGAFLQGSADLDADGADELLITRLPQGAMVPAYGTVQAVSIRDGEAEVRWQREGWGFEKRELVDFPLGASSPYPGDRIKLLVGPIAEEGRPVFFTRRLVNDTTAESEIAAWQHSDDSGDIEVLGTIKGRHVEIASTQSAEGSDAGFLLRAFAPVDSGGELSLSGFESEVVLSVRSGGPRCSPVVGRLEGRNAHPTVVIQGGSGTIVAFQIGASGDSGLRWSRSGRGIGTEYPARTAEHQPGALLLAKLHGDDRLSVIMGATGSAGQAALEALDAAGNRVWKTPLDRFAGGKQTTKFGGMLTWNAGRFRHPDREDILISLTRNTLHTEEFFMLDGLSGEILWNRDYGNTPGTIRPEHQRTAAVNRLAIFDWDGDGLDEGLAIFPDVFYVVDGNGMNLTDRNFIYAADGSDAEKYGARIFPEGWAFYATPAVDDFTGNGEDEILYGASSYMIGVLDKRGNPKWNGKFMGGTPAFLPGIGDVDGDGRVELVVPGHQVGGSYDQSQLITYDGATGEVLWAMPLPGRSTTANLGSFEDTPTHAVTGDVDGDGRDDALFAIANELWVVGATEDGRSGRLVWRKEFAANLGPPIFVDANDDGEPEIVVVCEDGNVYGIGQRK